MMFLMRWAGDGVAVLGPGTVSAVVEVGTGAEDDEDVDDVVEGRAAEDEEACAARELDGGMTPR